ncbi:hypothetical protein J2T60_000269 [Natronospira proteinivora]|uniref:Uncharacterized protein n=1 Tax=Natronospira proteinivora TaxID=1807133 RepID=A0ABT1G4T9_9GAMM|nr:hypothetical protein [Natronospira proteinivora]MCP1726304.1 hypothetical protein [Natronospira proteinivora]
MSAAFAFAMGQAAQREQDEGRSLTENEIEAARSEYGDDINYDEVRVYDRKWAFFQGDDFAMAPDGNIYWPGAEHCTDLTACTITLSDGRQVETLGTFIHEMAHVKQHQQGVNVVARGFWIQARRFFSGQMRTPYMTRQQFHQIPGPEGLNIEQQADWHRHNFCSRSGRC